MTMAFEPHRARVPRFFLYGEPPRQPDERFVHIELIADRSRLNDWTISPHVHPDLHHVLLLLEGRVEVRTDETSSVHPAPALLVIPAGVVHAFRFRPETRGYVTTAGDSLVGSLRAQERSFGRLFDVPRSIPLTNEDVEQYELRSSAQALLDELQCNAAARTVLIGARAQVLLAQAARIVDRSDCACSSRAGVPEARTDCTVEIFRRLIELHFHENWPLQRYADQMCISVAQLRATCIKVTGATSIKLLHERIIREAKRNLMFTTRPVAQIAYDLGFGDCAYFSRFFRARAGITPTEFRNSLRSLQGTDDTRVEIRQDATA